MKERWKDSVTTPELEFKYELFGRSVRLLGKLMEHEDDIFAPYRDGFRTTDSFENDLGGTIRKWRKLLRTESERQPAKTLSFPSMTLLAAEAWQYDLNNNPKRAAENLRTIEANLRWRWKERQ